LLESPPQERPVPHVDEHVTDLPQSLVTAALHVAPRVPGQAEASLWQQTASPFTT
jgi:hypothetical protein